MKNGKVLLIGRPNVGKSTLINTLIGQKVSITSPKPQTTRFAIEALYKSDQGEIIFLDTPGIFNKAHDNLSKKINHKSTQSLGEEIDVVMYVVDPTRKRDFEEAKVLGLVRQMKQPKILVYNKADLDQTYKAQYLFLEDEFPIHVSVSAGANENTKELVNTIYSLLPEDKVLDYDHDHPHPALNMDSSVFLSELIREKVFLNTRKEIPYSTTVVIDEITERRDDLMYIKARILTTNDTYKKMIIGEGGKRIKQIGSMARSELELATSKKIYLEVSVETDKHWVETLN